MWPKRKSWTSFLVVILVIDLPVIAEFRWISLFGPSFDVHWLDASARPAEAILTLEPGLLLESGAGLLSVSAVDSVGTPLRIRPGQIELNVAGDEVTAYELVDFTRVSGGPDALVAILLDAGALGAGNAGAWLTACETFINDRSSQTRRAMYMAAETVTTVLEPGSEKPAVKDPGSLVDPASPSRLWDNVLATVTSLAKSDGPTRRVLVVVSDGLENLVSDHPMITCRQAAQQMRIPIYCIALQSDVVGSSAGLERLKGLAEGTGGRSIVADSGSFTKSLQSLLTQIENVQGIRFPVDDLPLPATAQVLVPELTAQAVSGTIDVRPVYRGRSLLLIWVLGVTAVVCGLGIGVYFRGSVGEFEVTVAEDRFMHRIPLTGMTIGKATSNDLNVLDRRVSRNHAVVRVNRGQVIITDLRSTNGTAVNGEQTRMMILNNGDRILLGGSVELVYGKKWRLL